MSQDTTLPPLPDERAAFEAWHAALPNNGRKAGLTLLDAWQARAAIAAQAPQSVCIGASITEGALHVAVQQHGPGKTVRLLGTARMDLELLKKQDCIVGMTQPGRQPLDDYAIEINRLRNVIQAACLGGTDMMIERWKALFPDAPVPTVKAQPVQENGSTHDAIARAMDMASMFAGSVAMNNVEQAEAYSASLRRKLWRIAGMDAQPAPEPAQQAQGVPALDKTRNHLSTMIGLVLGARQRGAAYEAGSAIDKAVQEAIGHLKNWPQAPAVEAEPQPEREPLTDEQWLKRWTAVSGQQLKPGLQRMSLLSTLRFAERVYGIGTKGGE